MLGSFYRRELDPEIGLLVDLGECDIQVAGEEQEIAADEATLELLGNLPDNPDVEQAQTEFEKAQKVEEQFDKDFDGIDFAGP
jgi:hypothetical protein